MDFCVEQVGYYNISLIWYDLLHISQDIETLNNIFCLSVQQAAASSELKSVPVPAIWLYLDYLALIKL